MICQWVGVVFLVATVGATPLRDTKARFDGFRVYRVLPSTHEQVAFLQDIERHYNDYIFWTPPVLNTTVDVMVSPFLRIDFRDLAKSVGLKTATFIDDVQKLIDVENPKLRANGNYDWQAYYPLDTVYSWLRSLPGQYEQVELIENIGKTTEERDILGVKISSGKKNNKVIFVESGIHAREWITVATATYLINKLLTSNNEDISNIANNFDWYIVPSTNPDGYAFTHGYNRMWRKTRSKGTKCYGADPNRNWDYEWNNNDGSSGDECSETYRGSSKFSEPETKRLSEYLTKLSKIDTNELLVYFSIHSYSQVLMIPFGLPADVASNVNELNTIGQQAVNELRKRNGTEYGFGNIYTAIKYKASGGSMDWVKKELKVKYTFEWELRDKGRYGFLLPASQIIDTAEETIDSMVYILKQVQKNQGLARA